MALTKIPGELFDVDDLDLSDVGTIALDAIKGEADTDTSITFSGSNVITVKANNANQITFIDGAIVPSTDNDIDLGTSSVEFKDAFFDGTVTSDAFAGPLTGNVTGDVSGSSGSTTGNAATATALATGRTIGGTSFDGTANIAVALSATSTALATARTIGGTSFDGTANIAVALAATATALASARTIHGVSFDGTANIDLSEVVADTVGAMFSSNTETGITATYQDGDNTIDLVVGTLNQDTTGTAAGLAGTPNITVGTVTGTTITASTAIVPDASDGAAIGSASLEWSDLFLADGAVINFGDDQDVSLTHVVDTGLLLSSSDQLQFGDAGTYIHQSADGVLDLVADSEVELTANLIDINGAVAMDGAMTGGTNITISGELDAATLDISGNADIDGTLETDNLTVGGAQGSDGQVLTSTGSGVGWEDAGGGGASAIDDLSDAKSGGTDFTSSLILGHQTTGTLSAASYNTAVGFGAMDAITQGDENVCVGYQAGTVLTTGVSNAFLGSGAGGGIVSSGQCVAVGGDALRHATGGYNTAVGYSAGSNASNTATWNTFLGWNAGKGTTSGSHNVYVGRDAGYTGANAAQSVAVGGAALYYNVAGNYNVAVGYGALMNTGSSGAVVSNNVAVGFNAGHANVAGTENVFIGTYAGDACGATTAHSHVLVGYNAGTSLTTAVSVTAIGRDAGAGLTAAGNNVFVGANAGKSATSNSTSCSVFIGANAGEGPILGYHNIAIGMNAFGNTGSGYGTNAYGNVMIGHYSGYDTTSGDYNTSLGWNAGKDITTGNYNVCLGYVAGKSASPSGSITTGTTRICLGDNQITNAYIKVAWTVTSDERDKADITNFTGGLDWVNAMRPVTYKWDERSEYVDKEIHNEEGEIIQEVGTSADILAAVPDGTHKKDSLQVGLLAQEVLAIEQANGYGSNNDTSLLVDLTEDETSYGLSYEKVVPILVSAIKELSAKVEALENE